jgi:hypothetical protein
MTEIVPVGTRCGTAMQSDRRFSMPVPRLRRSTGMQAFMSKLTEH